VASIYAPSCQASRMALWDWILAQNFSACWIWGGNFNMCELLDGSNCQSPVLHGTEARKWANLVDHHDLVNLCFAAVYRTGPRFSCQVIRARNTQQSRLDHIYASHRAEWFNHTKLLDHDASMALSDHVPVSAILNFSINQDERLPKSSYYKMDATLLANKDVMQQVEAALKEQSTSIDPRKAWVFGWTKIKKSVARRKTEEG
jgi:hypothetical protein